MKPPSVGNPAWRRLLGYLGPYRPRFICAVVAMSIYGATDGVIPFILQRVLDDIFGNRNKELLWGVVGVILVFAIIRAAVGFLEKYLMASLGLFIIRDLRNSIHSHLVTLSSSYFLRQSAGALITRVTNDTLLIKSTLTDGTAALIRDSVRVIALISAALYLDPVLGLVTLVVFPLGVLPVIRFGKRVKRLSRVGQEILGGLTTILHEDIAGHRVVQSFGMEDYERQRFQRENNQATRSWCKAEKYGALAGPVNEILASTALAGVIVYGGLSMMSGVKTQGDFIAFITAMLLLYEPLKKLGRATTAFHTGIAAAERVLEVIDTTPEVVDSPGAVALPRESAAVAFKGVWFRYPTEPDSEDVASRGQWALQDISFEARPGSTIALVGMSGGGKSTLVNLLPRFFDPDKGMITIGGQDIREYTLASLRDAVSVVTQHTFLFNDTVEANIAFGRLGASAEEVRQAAAAAYAHDFIERLPEGYSTMVGEQGFRLSGGERARIALARALLKNAPFLILDEATASLDSESETLVQAALDTLMLGRTVFVIAHRLSTIRGADQILVLQHGRIVERGTHQDLLGHRGEYEKLHRLQFGDELTVH